MMKCERLDLANAIIKKQISIEALSGMKGRIVEQMGDRLTPELIMDVKTIVDASIAWHFTEQERIIDTYKNHCKGELNAD